MNAPAGADAPRHTLLEDAQALLIGTLFVGIGLAMFRHTGLMTGGTVGLAFLAHYASGVPFGPLLFVINLPFYWLAWQRLGAQFTVKTLSAVTLLSGLSELMPHWLGFATLNPLFAALAGGALIGTGFIILFRHRASLGGLNTVVLWLQERYGWRAGIVQLCIDACILLASWPFTDARRLGLSVLGAAAMNFALAVNHKPGRYVAY